ncbi:ribosome maturation factor RimP [Corynebacterium sp. Marseille-P4321]|uniref:ribosome maturation factor RimP n=1 Tax=Corynebacterium sp. Marseille-P4321 TaxID=2736603 RepID=UPI00158AD4FF|nr:ribosome maturation factor RimP [Corynebacterium sp. Marseille-P4321]
MAFPTNDELEALVAPVAATYGMDVERIKTVKAGKKSQVVIALDSDAHPTLDDLEEVSNELSALFDAKEDAGEINFGAGYTLELTTPGVDLPLTAPRHFRRNRGRVLKLDDGAWRVGPLNAEETQVALVRAGKKGEEVRLAAVSELSGAVVEIEFNAPPAEEVELAQRTFDELEAASAEA